MPEVKIDIPVTLAADLRGHQHKAVTIGGTLIAGVLEAKGLLQTRSDSGDDATMRIFGRARFIAGGTVTRGDRLQVASGGFCTTAASGDTSFGYAETTITSGSVGRGVFNFISPTYHVSSNG